MCTLETRAAIYIDRVIGEALQMCKSVCCVISTIFKLESLLIHCKNYYIITIISSHK